MADKKLVVLNDIYPSYLLSILRNKETGIRDFRETMKRIGEYIGISIMNHLDYTIDRVLTPLGEAEYKKPRHQGEDIVIIGILRAALPLVEGLLKIYPYARVGFVGAKRVEGEESNGRDFDVIMNYYSIPSIKEGNLLIIADPMLASASTMIKVLDLLKPKINNVDVVIASVIAAEYGVNRLLNTHPYIRLFTVAIDPELNSKGYIVPGLGDAGDRSFG